MDKIELNNVFIELISPSVILITIKDNSIIDSEDILEIKKVNLKLTNGAKYGVISESGSNTTVSEKARALMASKPIEENRISTAFVINNLAQRILAKFYLKINKPNIPTRLFSKLSDAKDWTNNQVNQQ